MSNADCLTPSSLGTLVVVPLQNRAPVVGIDDLQRSSTWQDPRQVERAANEGAESADVVFCSDPEPLAFCSHVRTALVAAGTTTAERPG